MNNNSQVTSIDKNINVNIFKERSVSILIKLKPLYFLN